MTIKNAQEGRGKISKNQGTPHDHFYLASIAGIIIIMTQTKYFNGVSEVHLTIKYLIFATKFTLI